MLGATVIAAGVYFHPSPLEASVAEGVLESGRTIGRPFLDHLLVEKVFRSPSSTDPKYLLKRAVGDLLPPDLLTAAKRGFVIPIELWLRGGLKPLPDHLLNPQRLKKQGLFQPQFYDHFVRPHLEGRSTFT